MRSFKQVLLNSRVFILVLVAFMFGNASFAMGQPVTVVIDGQVLALDQPAMTLGERVFVPLRGVFESLGAQVTYVANTRSIKAVRGTTEVALTVGSRQAYVNGEARSLDAPPVVMGERVMVPLRFVSEALGAQVKWQAYNRTVSILSLTGGANNPPSYTGGPNNAPITSGPRIDSVTHNALGTLMPGDTLTVVLRGEPGGEATFDITNVTTEAPMQETSPGIYQGSYTVTQARDVRYASVTGHLRLNGRESNLVAVKAISIGGATTLANQAQVSPTPGSETNALRPQVTAVFHNPIQSSTVRFLVDGTDYTSQAQFTSNSATWTPPYDLSAGEHLILVTAIGTQGEQLSRKWNFFVSNGGNGNSNYIQSVSPSSRSVDAGQTVTVTMQGAPGGTATMTLANRQSILMTENPPGTYVGVYTAPSDLAGRYVDLTVRLQTPDGRNQSITDAGAIYVNSAAGGGFPLSVNSPLGGSAIPQAFDVYGTTQPNSLVRLRLLAPNGILGSVFGIQQEITNTQVRADSNGNFSAHLDTGNLSSGSRAVLLIQAQNDQGSQSPEMRVELVRQ